MLLLINCSALSPSNPSGGGRGGGVFFNMSLKQFGFQTSNYTTFSNNFSSFPLCITTLPWCPVAIVIDSFKGVFSNFDISLFDNLQQYSNTSTDNRFYACSNLKKKCVKTMFVLCSKCCIVANSYLLH